MNLDLKLPVSTSLADLNFAIQYRLFENKNYTAAQFSKAIAVNLENLMKRAKENDVDDLHISTVRFYHENNPEIRAALKGVRIQNSLSPLSSKIERYIEQGRFFENFVKKVQYSHHQCMWSASLIPEFFFENPVAGFTTQLTEDELEDLSPAEQSIVFSVPNFRANCMQAGYIKGNIKIAVAIERGNTKALNRFYDLLRFLTLNVSKPERIGLKNDFQIYHVTLSPSATDLEFHRKSAIAYSHFEELYNEQAVDKPKYVVHAEKEPVSNKGFKNLKDVQAFLNLIKKSVSALDDIDKPTMIYMRNMLPLLSVNDKNGPIDLSRFVEVLKHAK